MNSPMISALLSRPPPRSCYHLVLSRLCGHFKRHGHSSATADTDHIFLLSPRFSLSIMEQNFVGSIFLGLKALLGPDGKKKYARTENPAETLEALMSGWGVDCSGWNLPVSRTSACGRRHQFQSLLPRCFFGYSMHALLADYCDLNYLEIKQEKESCCRNSLCSVA